MASICGNAGFRGEALVIALAVAFAESGYDAHAENWASADSKWGPAVGLFQVRVLRKPTGSAMDRRREYDSMRDPINNVRFAYDLSKGGKDWSAWSAYTNKSYRLHLADARKAANNPAVGADPKATRSVSLIQNDWIDDDRAALPITVGGGAEKGELGNRVVGGTLDLTMAEASQVTLEMEDFDARLLRRGKLTEGVPLTVAGQSMIVTSVGMKQGPATPHVTMLAQPAGVVRLRGVVPVQADDIRATEYVRKLAKAAGLRFVGGPKSPVLDTIAPAVVNLSGNEAMAALDPSGALAHGERSENAWEIARRLAKDSTGYVCFEAGGTLYYATEDWLYDHAQIVRVHVQTLGADFDPPRRAIQSIGYPTLSRTIKRDANNAPYRHVEADLELPPGPGWGVLPGMRLVLTEPSGVVQDARALLVQTVSMALGDVTQTVRVRAASYTAPGDVESLPDSVVGDGAVGGSYGKFNPNSALVKSGNPRSAKAAVAWAQREANSKQGGWYRRCQNFVGQCYGHSSSGYASARIAWRSIPASRKHPGNRTPPTGALLYYDTPNNPYGHVALYMGNALLASNDYTVRDQIRVTPAGDIERAWRATYLGWAEPWFPYGSG